MRRRRRRRRLALDGVGQVHDAAVVDPELADEFRVLRARGREVVEVFRARVREEEPLIERERLVLLRHAVLGLDLLPELPQRAVRVHGQALGAVARADPQEEGHRARDPARGRARI
eukprot:29281-Pelagococcus_subviridis.AAC.13